MDFMVQHVGGEKFSDGSSTTGYIEEEYIEGMTEYTSSLGDKQVPQPA